MILFYMEAIGRFAEWLLSRDRDFSDFSDLSAKTALITHQDSGETLRRCTALRNAHQDKARMHPDFAIPKTTLSKS
ncbi:MAG: hypothetical protein HC800_07175 [Phormidesmis sp. RL_2_1]|nr:hypothetical protein [Phormidesmis sp. RL_2_1]